MEKWFNVKNAGVSNKVYFNKLIFPLSYVSKMFHTSSIRSQMDVLQFPESTEDIHSIYSTLDAKLGSKKYFMGENPTSLDAVVFGHLAIQYFAPMPDSSLREEIQKFPRLVNYLERVSRNLFDSLPDYDKSVAERSKVNIKLQIFNYSH